MNLRRSSKTSNDATSDLTTADDEKKDKINLNNAIQSSDDSPDVKKDEGVDIDTESNDSSDTGSEIFMPVGIAMKTTEISDLQNKMDADNVETGNIKPQNRIPNEREGQYSPNSHTNERSVVINDIENVSGKEIPIVLDNGSENRGNKTTKNESNININDVVDREVVDNIDVEMRCNKEEGKKYQIEYVKTNAKFVDKEKQSEDTKTEEDVGQLENNKIDDDVNEAKACTEIENRDNNMEMFEEKEENIFSNPDIFYENHSVSNSSIENKQIEANDDDDEHNISDDFKIGQQNKEAEEHGEGSSEHPVYENIESNVYLIDKKKSRCKEVRKMTCECAFEPDDPMFVGCDEDCLNRLLMIECNSRCPTANFCTNKNFQRGCQYDLELFKAGRKGWGLKAKEAIIKGSFIIEYCGEVVDYNEFHERTQLYHSEGLKHYYFMTLKTNEIIDATRKGSKSRFINHSCDPNCVTQKWTVNGFLRVGFFALHFIQEGEELCFDYQFQRYGEKPQTCYCGSANCRGVIGGEQNKAIPSYIEKIITGSPSSQAKKKGRKKQMNEFCNSVLADELNDLFNGTKWEICDATQTLELIRLMVKAESLHERQELLRILQKSHDATALKAFVRYKGLSLLWSWMVDASSNKNKYKVEILKTLSHIPIPNKNELVDSKLTSIVSKWSRPVSPDAAEKLDAPSDDEAMSASDNELKIDECGSTSQDDSPEDNGDAEQKKLTTSFGAESVEEGEILDTEDEIADKKSNDRTKRKVEREAARKREAAILAASLLEQWKLLKEVFRIPKKSQTPDRRPRIESDGSPLLDEKRLKNKSDSPSHSTPAVKHALPDSTFKSPPSKQRQMEMHKGTGAFVTRDSDEIKHTQTDDRGSSAKDEKVDSGRKGRCRKREWRKSPNPNDEALDSEKSRGRAADSTYNHQNESMADTNWSSYGDNGSRRDRWRRDHQHSYDNDRWNDQRDEGYNEANRNRGWSNNNSNKWNSSNNRNMNDNRYGNNNNNMHHGGWKNREQDNLENDSWRMCNNFWSGQELHFNEMNPALRPGMPSSLMSNQYEQNFNHMPNQPHHQPQIYSNANTGVIPPRGPNMMPQQGQNMMSVNRPPMFPQQPVPPQNPQVNIPQSSPLVSPMSNQPFNPVPTVGTSTKFDPTVQPDVAALNVVNQLQLLLNAERLKQQVGSHPSSPDFNRTSANTSPHRTSASPARSTHTALPSHWKTATDAEGRVYYYHAITRETSWDPPSQNSEDIQDVVPAKRLKKRNSSDIPHAPPMKHSPRIAAADTTNHHGPRTPPDQPSQSTSAAELQKIRDTFKIKISSVVVNCLNSYQKVDCKQGRIKNPDDFKFLARKLTHGLIMKEVQRIKDEELLNCNDSVKIKVKEYIRNYMKKFGPCYVRS